MALDGREFLYGLSLMACSGFIAPEPLGTNRNRRSGGPSTLASARFGPLFSQEMVALLAGLTAVYRL